MISGTVTPYRTMSIRLRVIGSQSQEQEVEAIIDTGFTDYLTLPRALIRTLALPTRGSQRARLADGSVVHLDLFRATVLWDGQTRAVLVHAAETDPLVGMSLLYGSRFTAEVVDGGPVTIEALGPRP
jgi:clan AA aspartic protease